MDFRMFHPVWEEMAEKRHFGVVAFLLCEAARAMDLGVREAEGAAEAVGALDDETLAQVMAVVLVALGLEGF